MSLSPAMQNYKDMKAKNKDYLLFYRLGDFYEMFFDDAIIASRELDITLTKKIAAISKRPQCAAFRITASILIYRVWFKKDTRYLSANR